MGGVTVQPHKKGGILAPPTLHLKGRLKDGGVHHPTAGALNKWDDSERAELIAELNAAFFHLYGISEDDARYILSTFTGIHDLQERLFTEHCSMAERVMQKYAEILK